ncbi:MAG: lipid-A-disaccharide synthase, partial [Burkholderiaceae bacterium]|nr:lipid-A-disaccharide synthase [Burkholderiaceae bacterium]
MRYYLIAGEASGDLHASNLMRSLKIYDQEAVFRCWGGDLMEHQGAKLVKHYRDLAFMGFMEVASHLPTILGNFRLCERDLISYRPDVLILIDYPGFNLRMAKFAGQHGIRVFYYISPQLWAWHSSRVKTIRKWVDRMFVILPFEKEFYARYDYAVDFHGHPLLDVINEDMTVTERNEFLKNNSLPDLPLI